MNAMTVTGKVLCVEVPSIFLDGPVKDQLGKELHHFREDIFTFAHNSELKTAAKLVSHSLQIVKCQTVLNNF